jgi:hypothetical protein
MFEKDRCVVLLSTCNGNPDVWKGRLEINYCYKLLRKSYNDYRGFMVYKDNNGIENGWMCDDKKYISILKLRYATTDEENKYNRLDEPFKTDMILQRRLKIQKLNIIS